MIRNKIKKFFYNNCCILIARHRSLVVPLFYFFIINSILLYTTPILCEKLPLDITSPSGINGSTNKLQGSDPVTAKKQDSMPASLPEKQVGTLSPTDQTKKQDTTPVFIMTKGVMCESIKGFEPADSGVVFSISLGKIFCFTAFQNISQNTFIYHKWFHRDRFVATNRFLVKAPQWSTFSTMQLRVADKGPWRVEITDDKDILLKTLRFSVSD